jgi:hypothetical protein
VLSILVNSTYTQSNTQKKLCLTVINTAVVVCGERTIYIFIGPNIYFVYINRSGVLTQDSTKV